MRISTLLQGAQARIIDSSRHWDYAWCALFVLASFVSSAAIGTFFSVHPPVGSEIHRLCEAAGVEEIVFKGYGASHWWALVLAAPVALYVLRWTASRILGTGRGDPTRFHAPLTALVKDKTTRVTTTSHLLAAGRDPRNLIVVLLLVIVIHVFDLREVAGVYFDYAAAGKPTSCPREADWSLFFLVPGTVSPLVNAAHVLLAFASQFISGLFALMVFALFLRHNVYYVSLVYQRYRERRGNFKAFIVLDFEDPKRCFGQEPLHPVFNIQISFLVIAGLFVSISRYANVTPEVLKHAYEQLEIMAREEPGLLAAPFLLKDFIHAAGPQNLFPDVGQVILALAWGACFLIVSVPSLIKFLPFRHESYRSSAITQYLAQFVPLGWSPEPLDMNDEEISLFAEKFARNSFWPAGDQKAELLFWFAYAVFLFVMVPLPLISWGITIFNLFLLALVSFALTKLTFLTYRRALRYVDKRLIEEK